jgi:hypothetical protein
MNVNSTEAPFPQNWRLAEQMTGSAPVDPSLRPGEFGGKICYIRLNSRLDLNSGIEIEN